MDEQNASRARTLRRELARWAGVPAGRVRVVRSPYRACPLGAHVDHQLGCVTGMALDRALLLAFVPRADGAVALRSRQFPGTVEFRLEDVAPAAGDWADYARGAALALRARGGLTTGITALVDGYTNVGGLSSSAAVGVAYLLAFEAANGMANGPDENIELDRFIENNYVGLSNGILDQSTILLGRRGHLLHMDCRDGARELVPLGDRRGGGDFVVAVLFSGLRIPLAQTDYNRRVGECRRAAELLLRAAGMQVPEPPYLRAVPEEVFAERGAALPALLRRRAAHFFGEQERVRRGVETLAAGRSGGLRPARQRIRPEQRRELRVRQPVPEDRFRGVARLPRRLRRPLQRGRLPRLLHRAGRAGRGGGDCPRGPRRIRARPSGHGGRGGRLLLQVGGRRRPPGLRD